MRFPFFLLILLFSATTVLAEQAEIEFFEKKIRPVLVEHCYECHSTEANAVKGGLLLDSREALLAGGDSGPAMVPGKPEASLLIESLKYESYEMPPAQKLPEDVIRDFELWIQQGAVDPRKATAQQHYKTGIDWEQARQFWSFKPLAPLQHPQLSTTNAIDRAIDQQLTDSKIAANLPAAPEQLIRRLYYDLTGLPPSADQVIEFMNDPSPNHYEQIADQLLQSPLFGEHWGRHWLDVVRYADSNGGDFNATYRNAWRYRDYVIDSFNEDKPIDEFFREQISGDLMPADSLEEQQQQMIATGFLMVGPKMLSERDKEKLKYDVIDEQIDSMGKVFLGLSLGCARCHDHKFDPVPTADYYALAGIFQGTQVLDGESQQYVSDWVRRDLPTTDEHRQQLKAHQELVGELTKKIKSQEKQIKAEEAEIEKLMRGLETITIDDQQAKTTGTWTASTYFPQFVGTGYIHDNKEDKGAKEVLFSTTVSKQGKYRILFGYTGSAGRDRKVPVTVRYLNQEQVTYIDESKPPTIYMYFESLGEYEIPAETEVEIIVSTAGTTEYVTVDAVQLERLNPDAAQTEKSQEVKDRKAVLQKQQAQLKELQAELAKLKKQAPSPIPQAFAVKESEDCEDCTIMIRGDHRNPGDEVPRGTLQIISGHDAQLEDLTGSGRDQLANWLVMEARALVARVYVNRVWMYLNGEGIVRSVDNFGTLGIPPTHPELLDQLSQRFLNSGWSTKQLVRAIVLSQVYQRSSRYNEQGYKIDPENLLLWRANRRPLTAEELRDTLVQFQQKLDLTAGGSTVDHLGRMAIDNTKSKQSSLTSDDYSNRRSVYHPVIRNQLAEIRFLFDFANPEMVVGKRPPTNVPAQSLFLLNNDRIRETARSIVQTQFAEHGQGSYSALNDIYLMVFSRLPTRGDEEMVRGYIESRLQGEIEAARVEETWTDVVQALLASTEFRFVD